MGVSLKPMLVTGAKTKVAPGVSGKNVKTRQVMLREKREETPVSITRNDHYLIADPPFARGGFGAVNYAIDVRKPQHNLVAKTMACKPTKAADGYEFKAQKADKIETEIEALSKLQGPLQLVDAKKEYSIAEPKDDGAVIIGGTESKPDHGVVIIDGGAETKPEPEKVKVLEQATLLMTHMPGDMGKMVRKLSEDYSVDQRRVVLRAMVADVGEQLQSLHQGGYLHLDLKADNFLFDKNGAVCLADFGLAKSYKPGETLKGFAGTPHTMAPEIDRSWLITPPSEVWALFMSWAHAAAPRNDFFARQVLRTDALKAPNKAKEKYKNAEKLHANAETANQMPKEVLDTLEREYKQAHAQCLQIRTNHDPYNALAKWKKSHALPLDANQLREEAQTDPMSDFAAQLWHIDPEMCTLGFRDVLWLDPHKRISLGQFVQQVRALQPANSPEEHEARNLLKQSLGDNRKARNAYAALREYAEAR